jgi:hypothetical protein
MQKAGKLLTHNLACYVVMPDWKTVHKSVRMGDFCPFAPFGR